MRMIVIAAPKVTGAQLVDDDEARSCELCNVCDNEEYDADIDGDIDAHGRAP